MNTRPEDTDWQYRSVLQAAHLALYGADDLPVMLASLDSRTLHQVKALARSLDSAAREQLARRRFNEIWIAAGNVPTLPSLPDVDTPLFEPQVGDGHQVAWP